MAFDARIDLVSAIEGWLNRDDLSARVDDFIRLAEVRFNRLLRDPDQIVSANLAFASGLATLPDDFGEMITFGPAGTHVDYVLPSEFDSFNAYTGDARVYTIQSGTLRVLPRPTDGTIPIGYYAQITPLIADGDTNWLLTRAPDIYLYGALLQAEFYGWNDARLPLIKQGLDEALLELRADGQSRRWGAGGLSPRIRRA